MDAKSLYDHLHSDAMPTEKRVMLDLLAFREGLERPEDEIFWMLNQLLADYLTKAKVDDFAIDYLLSRGEYALSEEALEGPRCLKEDQCGAPGMPGPESPLLVFSNFAHRCYFGSCLLQGP